MIFFISTPFSSDELVPSVSRFQSLGAPVAGTYGIRLMGYHNFNGGCTAFTEGTNYRDIPSEGFVAQILYSVNGSQNTPIPDYSNQAQLTNCNAVTSLQDFNAGSNYSIAVDISLNQGDKLTIDQLRVTNAYVSDADLSLSGTHCVTDDWTDARLTFFKE